MAAARSSPSPKTCPGACACSGCGTRTAFCGPWPSRLPADRRPTGPARSRRPLWLCPRCRRRFANHNQSHACGRHDLAHHFEGKDAAVRALYAAVRKAIAACGPVTILSEKTRIAFQVRMSFAQVTPRKHWLDGHVVLARRLESPRFRTVQTFSPRNHLHTFRISGADEIDDELRGWLVEAYSVGSQEHLRK